MKDVAQTPFDDAVGPGPSRKSSSGSCEYLTSDHGDLPLVIGEGVPGLPPYKDVVPE